MHLQLHEGRLPLQSLHLQELQLLMPRGPHLPARCGPHIFIAVCQQRARALALASLLLWLSVAICGRMIAYS